jgi:hypothetical protein
MHTSGGATRDVIPFESQKVASRMYKVLLPSLEAGEYGFLPPGAIGSANSASIGKMYTFRLTEEEGHWPPGSGGTITLSAPLSCKR